MADAQIPNNGPACNNCRFWRRGFREQISVSECRRSSPRFEDPESLARNMDDRICGPDDMWENRLMARWPITDESDWCGEWAALA